MKELLEAGVNPGVATRTSGYKSTEGYKGKYQKGKISSEEMSALLTAKLSALLEDENPLVVLKAMEIGLKHFGSRQVEEKDEYDMDALEKTILETRLEFDEG